MKEKLLRFYRWEYFWLVMIVLVSLAMHFFIIDKPTDLVFDEAHYIADGRTVMSGNETARYEHPPLGKLFIIGSMFMLGDDNPVGYRFLSIMFGTLSILLLYLICKRLGLGKRGATIAAFLLAFENMCFVQSSVAMLDVYSMTFMLFGFYLYLRNRYILAGIVLALCALCKLGGALAVPVVMLHWFFARRDQRIGDIINLALTSALAFILIMIPLDYMVFHRLIDPYTRVTSMFSGMSQLTFETARHDAMSRPWEWLYNPWKSYMAYWYTPHYTSGMNFNLWVLIVPAFVYSIWRWLKDRSEAGIFVVAWVICIYIVWIPASYFTDRISFIYYFYPVVPGIILGVTLAIEHLLSISAMRTITISDDFGISTRQIRKFGWLRWLVAVFLIAHMAVFLYLSPVLLQNTYFGT